MKGIDMAAIFGFVWQLFVTVLGLFGIGVVA